MGEFFFSHVVISKMHLFYSWCEFIWFEVKIESKFKWKFQDRRKSDAKITKSYISGSRLNMTPRMLKSTHIFDSNFFFYCSSVRCSFSNCKIDILFYFSTTNYSCCLRGRIPLSVFLGAIFFNWTIVLCYFTLLTFWITQLLLQPINYFMQNCENGFNNLNNSTLIFTFKWPLHLVRPTIVLAFIKLVQLDRTPSLHFFFVASVYFFFLLLLVNCQNSRREKSSTRR